MKLMNPRLVCIARKLDPVWKVLAVLRSRRLQPIVSSATRNVLVIDLHLVGDIVMLLPLLEAIRARFPAARVTLLAGPWARPVIVGSGDVDEVVEYAAPWVRALGPIAGVVGYLRIASRLRSMPWDIGIDVRGDVRQILLLFLAGCSRRIGFDFSGGGSLLTDIVPDDGSYAHILTHHERIAALIDAWNGRPFVPVLTLTESEKIDAAQIVPFIGFHFGASLSLRRLPAEQAVELLQLHVGSADPLVVFAPPDLDDYLSDVRSRLPAHLQQRLEFWRGGLRSFIVKASRAKLMFTMDSGPAHIAAGLGRDTVVFFGPNLPRYTGPRSPNVRFIEELGVRCRPCDQHRCVNAVHQACMKGLVERWQSTLRKGI